MVVLQKRLQRHIIMPKVLLRVTSTSDGSEDMSLTAVQTEVAFQQTNQILHGKQPKSDLTEF